MNRYLTNEDPLEPNPIGIGAWALIPIGLFLVGLVLLSQYGLVWFLSKPEDNQPKAADEPAVSTTQAGSQQQLQNSIGMSLTQIPAGEFSIKGTNLSDNVSGPQTQLKHGQVLDSFYMGTCEVTNEQYYAVMQSFQHRYKPANRPAAKVSWPKAVEFCRRLSALEAEQQLGHVYRLPTEPEWEYACRAGTQTAYSFSGTSVNTKRETRVTPMDTPITSMNYYS